MKDLNRDMKKYLVTPRILMLCLGFAFASALGSCNQPNSETSVKKKQDHKQKKVDYGKNAQLVFESNKLEFGDVPADTVISGKYVFKNPSQDTLRFEYVNPDCTCTSYEISSKKIAPGQSGWIKLVLDTKNKTGKQAIYAVTSTNTSEKFHKLVLLCNVK